MMDESQAFPQALQDHHIPAWEPGSETGSKVEIHVTVINVLT